MYDEIEVEISRRYLDRVTEVLDEPIAMLGGWAVYLIVNDGYKGLTGRDYIGSRDIDLGFHIDENSESKTLNDVIKTLSEELGFSPLSFRLFKEIHRETGMELDKETARRTPSYNIFPMYVDLIVDHIPDDFRERFGFNPVDEPLLGELFRKESERTNVEFLGKLFWLPSPKVLLAMKVKSYPSRDKEHKRIKDMCDISSLLLFTEGWGKASVIDLVGQDVFQKFQDTINEENLLETSRILDIDPGLIRSALDKFIK
ncbi:MAG: hypothetical protein KAH57_03510 [Thermoplasmata archaeon]|nr:hypothetical protein [Thermoplasmata archaeon]